MNRRKCESCDDLGIRAPATPACRLEMDPSWTVVERCDACEKYSGDFEAAQELFREVRWIVCENGGDHVIGRRRRIRPGGFRPYAMRLRARSRSGPSET